MWDPYNWMPEAVSLGTESETKIKETFFEGHRLMVIDVPGGRGFCPIDLLAADKFKEAADVAARAFKAGVR